MKLLNFRASEEEIAVWRETAALLKLSLSEFIRDTLNKKVGAGGGHEEVSGAAPTLATATSQLGDSRSPSRRERAQETTPASHPSPKKTKPKVEMCPHRIPAGMFCKRCP